MKGLFLSVYFGERTSPKLESLNVSRFQIKVVNIRQSFHVEVSV